MAVAMDKFRKGEAPAAVSDILPSQATRDVNQMRKTLLSYLKSAKTSEDKRAAGRLYDAYNDWTVTAAIKSGDVSIAANMMVARGMTRQMHEIFSGNKIMAKVLEHGDTPELIVNALFSAPKGDIKAGSMQALQALKRGYDTYLPPDAAKAAWDDIRMAYWLRNVRQRTGENAGPAAMSSAIKAMFENQGTMARTLFKPEEIGRLRRLAAILDDVKKRNPNTSWSGVSIGAFMKDIGDTILTMIGANSVIGKMAVRLAAGPIRTQYGAVQARQATGNLQGYQLPRQRPLAIAGPASGAGGAIGASSQQ